jgi:hypothetical protein
MIVRPSGCSACREEVLGRSIEILMPPDLATTGGTSCRAWSAERVEDNRNAPQNAMDGSCRCR